MLRYKHKQYYFDNIDDYKDHAKFNDDIGEWEDIGWWRRFIVKELCIKDIGYLNYWHHLFEELVGIHCTYDKDGRTISNKYDADTHLNSCGFYDRKKTEYIEPDYKNAKIIGWFEINR